jgi:hypothetical protein
MFASQFTTEVEHPLTAPRIPHEEFGSLMIFWIDDRANPLCGRLAVV